MTGPIFRHLVMTLRLNFRSRQAIIYGYVIPVFFLFAFAAIFRWDSPPLLGQMGQLVTVTVLGGACFGMPTALVAERERGIWRRYRLLPAPLVGLVGSTLIARYLIVGSAVLMQIGIAWLFYRTPMPVHPGRLLVAFTIVAAAFEGIGLVVAAIADTVPAVQALGQLLFLPMIMVGGVGVPLAQLPHWAQNVAGFFPGRYAVQLMQPCFDGSPAGGWAAVGYGVALGVIAAGGFAAGGLLFRWESSQRATGRSLTLAAAAAVPWVAVGIVAMSLSAREPSGRKPSTRPHLTRPFTRPAPAATTSAATTSAPVQPWDLITVEQIRAISFEGLPPDNGTVAPVAASATELASPPDKAWMEEFVEKLAVWEPGQLGSSGDRVRRLLAAASIADLMELSELEGPIGRAVFDRLDADLSPQELVPILTWIILKPDDGAIVTDLTDLGLAGKVNASVIRKRSQIYALKLLGRKLGKLPDVSGDGT